MFFVGNKPFVEKNMKFTEKDPYSPPPTNKKFTFQGGKTSKALTLSISVGRELLNNPHPIETKWRLPVSSYFDTYFLIKS